MPPNVALSITLAFIYWLFKKDRVLRQFPSTGLWIPAIWLAIAGSKPVTLWLAPMGIPVGASSNLEGSPIDMIIFLGLMVASVAMLARRGFNVKLFLHNNKALISIYLYFVASALWAEYSIPTFKRALKDFGHVLPALVLLSEADQLNAIRIVFVRVSYLLLPLSVVLIKYFPDVGRVGNRSNDAMFTGVTTHKNTLGCSVFVFCVFLVVDIIEMRRKREGKASDRWIRYGLLGMGAWLLLTCQSVTSTISLALACILLWGMRRLVRMQDPQLMLFRSLVAITLLAVGEYLLDVSGAVLRGLGRDSTLTGRTEIWEMVRETKTDPLFGSGFYSYWNTEGAKEISELFKGTLSTVHNGFIEMYLDCGAVGVALLILLLAVWGRRCVVKMLDGSVFGSVALTFWIVGLVRNFSETEYFRFTALWFTLLLLMIESPPMRHALVVPRPRQGTGVPRADEDLSRFAVAVLK